MGKLIKIFMSVALMLGISLQTSAQLPDSYNFNRGVEAYQESKVDEAIEWFEKEVSANPHNGYAYIYLSTLRKANKENGQALTAINQALKVLPKKDKAYTAVALATRADVYLVMEDSVKAEQDLTAAIRIQPENKNYYNRRGQLYFEQNRFDLSDADYLKMTELDPGDVMGYMGLGRNAKNQGDFKKAMETFNYVIRLEPDYSSGYSFRADCYIAEKKYSEALDDLIKALSIDNDRKAYYTLVNLDAAAIPLAKAKFQVQANKNPNDAEWYYYLAQLLKRRGKNKEAIAFYKKANERDANAAFLERIADSYFELGDYNNALDYVNRASSMDADDYEIILLKGNILNEMGNQPAAITELDKLIEKYPDFGYFYYRRGWFRDEQKDHAGAIEDYTMAIALDPEYAYSYIGRGRDYEIQGDKAAAIADYKKVIELDTVPQQGSCAHYAYLFMGDKAKAIDFMQRYLNNPDEDDSDGGYYDAACLYSLMGEKTKALEYLETAFKKGYRRLAHLSVDRDLENIRNTPEFDSLVDKYRKIQEGEADQATDKPGTMSLQRSGTTMEVPFTKENGVTKVQCKINDLPLYFVFDTGAADVTLSLVEANFMLKNEFIKPTDVVGTARYVDANGDIVEGTVINLRKVDFGGLELDNVRASVVRNQKAPLLLGQSVLGRLGSIEIDNRNQRLVVKSFQ